MKQFTSWFQFPSTILLINSSVFKDNKIQLTYKLNNRDKLPVNPNYAKYTEVTLQISDSNIELYFTSLDETKVSMNLSNMTWHEKYIFCDFFVFLPSMSYIDIYSIEQMLKKYTSEKIPRMLFLLANSTTHFHINSTHTETHKYIYNSINNIRSNDFRNLYISYQHNLFLKDIEIKFSIIDGDYISMIFGSNLILLTFKNGESQYTCSVPNFKESIEIKSGPFFNMFIVLGCCDRSTFLKYVDDLFGIVYSDNGANINTYNQSLERVCNKVDYKTHFQLSNVSILTSGLSPVMEIKELEDSRHMSIIRKQIMNMRKQYINSASTKISAVFKGWKTRMKYRFNPHTSLGKYEVMKVYNNALFEH